MLKVRGRPELITRFDPSLTPLIPTPNFTSPSPTQNALIGGTTGIGPTAGVIAFDIIDDAMSTAGANSPIILCLSSGTSATERLYLRKSNTGNRLASTTQSGGTTETWSNYNVAFPSGTNKAVIAWGSGYLRFYINGMLFSYIDSGHIMPNIDSIYVGRLNSGTSNNYSKTVNNIKLWNRELSDAACRAICKPTILSGITFDADKSIVMFMGQSNSSGVAVTSSPVYTNTSRMFLLSNALTSIASYSDPYDITTSARMTALNDATAAGSYAGYFIDTLAGLTGKDIVACPANISSTSFDGTTPSWNVRSSFATYRTAGTKFFGMGPSAAAAINQTIMAQQFANVVAMALGLGEQDIASGTSEATYQASCGYFIDELRAATFNPMPIILMGVPAYNVSWAVSQPQYDAIQNAQTNLAATKSQVVKPSGTDIPGGQDSGLHYSQASNAIVGPIGANACFNIAFDG